MNGNQIKNRSCWFFFFILFCLFVCLLFFQRPTIYVKKAFPATSRVKNVLANPLLLRLRYAFAYKADESDDGYAHVNFDKKKNNGVYRRH